MKAFIITILSLALILYLAYAGILDRAPAHFLFVNDTEDTIDVKISFKYRFYYTGIRGDSNNVQYAPLKNIIGNTVVLSRKEEILKPGVHIFQVSPKQKIVLGIGENINDLKNIYAINFVYNDSIYNYNISSIKSNSVKSGGDYILSIM